MRLIYPFKFDVSHKPYFAFDKKYVCFSMCLYWDYNQESELLLPDLHQEKNNFLQSLFPVVGNYANSLIDQGLPKTQAEWMVFGQCHLQAPADFAQVTCQVGESKKTLAVFGPRQWEKDISFSTSPSKPEVFQDMAILPMMAAGHEKHPLNPHGKQELAPPTVEIPGSFITSPKDNRTPALFAPLPLECQALTKLKGTYDNKWAKEKRPFLPDDFKTISSMRCLEDQRIAGFFRGDESFSLLNMHPFEAKWERRLPGYKFRLFYNSKEGAELTEAPCNLDTLVFMPDTSSLELYYRALVPVSKIDYQEELQDIVIAFERLEDKRPESYYQEDYKWRFEELIDESLYQNLITAPLCPSGHISPMRLMLDKQHTPAPEVQASLNKAQEIIKKNTPAKQMQKLQDSTFAKLDAKTNEQKNHPQFGAVLSSLASVKDGVAANNKKVQEGQKQLDKMMRGEELDASAPEQLQAMSQMQQEVHRIIPHYFTDFKRVNKDLLVSKNFKKIEEIHRKYNEESAAKSGIEQLEKLKDLQAQIESTQMPEKAKNLLLKTNQEHQTMTQAILAAGVGQAPNPQDKPPEPLPRAPKMSMPEEVLDCIDVEELNKQHALGIQKFNEMTKSFEDAPEGPENSKLKKLAYMKDLVNKHVAKLDYKEMGKQQDKEMAIDHLTSFLSQLHAIQEQPGLSPHGDKHQEVQERFTQLLQDKDIELIEEEDFATCEASGLRIENKSFRTVYLEQVDFSSCEFINCSFEECALIRTNFDKAQFTNCQIINSNAAYARFTNQAINDQKIAFKHTKYIGEHTHLVLDSIDFSESRVSSPCRLFCFTSILNKAKFHKTHFHNLKFDNVSFMECDFRQAVFEDCLFKLATFATGCNLGETQFSECRFNRFTFTECFLRELDLSDCVMRQGLISEPLDEVAEIPLKLSRSIFSSSTIKNAENSQFLVLAQNSNFQNTSFEKGDYSGSDFTGSSFRGVYFIGSNLGNCNFSDADLTESSFYCSYLKDTKFTGANLFTADLLRTTISTGTDFSGAYLKDTLFEHWRPSK